jgi:membrane peptidoglycan carboxypeptidase
MTSYGDPHAGQDYDDGYYQQKAGRAQVPGQDGYGYPEDGGYPAQYSQDGYGANGGYGDQNGYAGNGAGYPPSDSGYSPDANGYSGAGGYNNGNNAGGYPDNGAASYPGSGNGFVSSGQGYNGYGDNGYSDNNGYADRGSYSDNGGYAAEPNGYDGYANEPNYAVAAPAAGRASVPTGRASVPMPVGPPPGGMPGGMMPPPMLAPAPSGRASVRPPSLDGEEEPAERRPKKSTKRKRAKWQKWTAVGIAVVVLLAGGVMIGGTYFYDQVSPPDVQKLKNTTEILSADGVLLAKLGNENRSEIAMADLSEEVKHALIAGEDKNFYDHDGIDLWGIGRAAWNNLTGGETQGASTITQQYARQAAQDLDVTYARKLREAVMARKLEDQYTKDEILGFYLNTVYFGRGAHGIGAAAEAYFKIPPDQIKTLKVEQAAVLGAVLKQPEGKNGFDPNFNPQNSKDRFNYVLNNMVEMNWLSAEARAAAKYPDPVNPEAPVPGELQKYDEANAGGAIGYTDRGTGYVVNYVAEELEANGIIQKLKDQGYGSWKNAGLRIITTINPIVQNALEAQLNRDIPGSTVNKQRPNIVGAGVSIDQKTGRVLAYYGGSNSGSKLDYAGTDVPHPPASSFKIYTLAAAIEANYSTQSMWDPTPLKKGVNGANFDLGNANREGELACETYCSLEEMTVKSYNVPFFQIAEKITPKKIAEMAHKAGVQTMWGTNPFQPYDLNKPESVQASDPFFYHIGFGQYPITVLDHAVGTATLANHGVYNKPHFIMKVDQKDRKSGQWVRLPEGDEQLKPEQTVRAAVADEVTSVLKKIAPKLNNGTDAAGKTGTWENGKKKEDGKTYVFPNTNAHVWFTGFTNDVTTAIWFGSSDENGTPIKLPGATEVAKLGSRDNIGSGFPKDVWKKFMDQVNKDLAFKSARLTNGSGGAIGSKDMGTGKSPTPAAPDCTMFPQLCGSPGPGDGGGNGGPGNGGPGNGGGGGGGNGILPLPNPFPRPSGR